MMNNRSHKISQLLLITDERNNTKIHDKRMEGGLELCDVIWQVYEIP